MLPIVEYIAHREVLLIVSVVNLVSVANRRMLPIASVAHRRVLPIVSVAHRRVLSIVSVAQRECCPS